MGTTYKLYAKPSNNDDFVEKCEVVQVTGGIISDNLIAQLVFSIWTGLGPQSTVEVRTGSTVVWRLGPAA